MHKYYINNVTLEELLSIRLEHITVSAVHTAYILHSLKHLRK